MKKYNTLISLLLSIFTSFALLFEITEKGLKIGRSNTMMFTYLVLALFLFVFYQKYLGKFKGKTTFRVIAIIFSLLLTLGYSYDIAGNSSLVFSSISNILFSVIKIIGLYALISTSIHLLNDIIVKKKLKNTPLPKILTLFDKHPFLFSFIVILICYLPYIIAYYPVIINYDAANQIKEVMGMHTRYMDSVILLNPDVTITNFNPIIHTLLIGGLFKLGYLIGNVNFGMFLYSIIQVTIVISSFSYAIYYLKKENVNNKLILLVLGVFSLVPLFPFYAMTAVKDVIFSSLILIYVIKLYDIIKYKQTIKQYIFFFFLILLITLFRNNGIYTILLSLPFLFYKNKARKALIIILILNISLYIGYNKVLLPHLEIANTSIREVLSVPFQQTARLVKYYDDEINDEDKLIIDKVLDYDTLADRYDPELSDDVKNKFNKYTTDEELKEYFLVWLKYLFRRPGVYIDATINNIYGYFYPNTSKWYIYTKLNEKLPEAGFNYHYNNLDGIRSVLSGYAEAYPYIPIIGIIANIAFVVWTYILLIGILTVNNLKKYLILLLPSLSLILVCIVGPANTYFRYILPCIFSLPPLLCLLYQQLTNKQE